MDPAETKDLALEALEEFRSAALADPASYAGGGDGAREVARVVGALRMRLEPTRAANPAFAPAHEAAAALVVLAGADHDAYGTLMGPVARSYAGGETRPGTLGGLRAMDDFLATIGDDHEWAVDGSGPTPVVRAQPDFAQGRAPTLTPRALRDVIVPLLDAAAAPRP